jgi:hypothetical protein
MGISVFWLPPGRTDFQNVKWKAEETVHLGKGNLVKRRRIPMIRGAAVELLKFKEYVRFLANGPEEIRLREERRDSY